MNLYNNTSCNLYNIASYNTEKNSILYPDYHTHKKFTLYQGEFFTLC